MTSPDLSGYLSKWTNMLKGYQKRWFLLQGSLLSYYRHPENINKRCRGTFDLKNATLDVPSSQDSFVIVESSGRKHHLKALSVDDKNKWVKALSDVINAVHHTIDGESDSISEDSFVVQSQPPGRSNRRWPFRSRNRQKLDATTVAQDPHEIRKHEKVSPSDAPGMGSRADRPTTPIVDPGGSPKFDPKDRQLNANFNRLINRLRRSSVTMEVAALYDLISSVDTFRTRLKQHTDSLCAHITTIETKLLLPESEAVLTNNRSATPDVCPSCRHFANLEKDGSLARFRLSLDDHRQYVKEFQETCLDALQFLVNNVERWHKRIMTEQERCIGLERTVEQLARQHRALELQLGHCYSPLTEVTSAQGQQSRTETLKEESRKTSAVDQSFDATEEDMFFDATSTLETESPSPAKQQQTTISRRTLQPPPLDLGLTTSASMASLRNGDESSCSDSSIEEQVTNEITFPSQRTPVVFQPAGPVELPLEPSTPTKTTCIRVRRNKITASPKIALNLWSIMKNAIGKDLTKIPLPVNFNEPISFLQRASEDLTYSELLDKASTCHDPADQMALVAAFSVSCYASTAIRTGKPFNPLLGETYELDRTDDRYGWRLIAEQVSHHPPGSAVYCESPKYGWKLWFEFVLVSKFRGKYMSILPKGVVNLLLPDGSRYTWTKVTTVVHNLIVGTLWIDNCGDVVIRNHTNGFECSMRFIAHSYFSRGPQKQVSGLVQTATGLPTRRVQGCWDSYIECLHVDGSGAPLTEPEVLWRADPLPPDADKMYNFSQFTIELNEPEPDVAPTDSRFRPDQRLMEDGSWDAANEEKRRIEQKQRNKRHKWEEQQAAGVQPLEPLFTPVWFAPRTDPVTGEQSHTYSGKYWSAKALQNWDRCPDIF